MELTPKYYYTCPICCSTSPDIIINGVAKWDMDDKALGRAALEAAVKRCISGDTSDGYHTFDELYHHRAILFSVLVATFSSWSWKSKVHRDATMFPGMFIVGINTPDGQATYHYSLKYWDRFKCKGLEKAPKWDGHSPQIAIERISRLVYLS